MFYPLLIVIVTLMVSANLDSIYTLKIGQYNNQIRSTLLNQFIYQEKIVKEAVDSYCRKNITSCPKITDTNLTLSDISNYTLNGINDLNVVTDDFFLITIDPSSNSILLKHKMTLDQRKKYFNDFLNKNEDIYCENGSTPPCDSEDVIKMFTYSIDLKRVYILEQIRVLKEDTNSLEELTLSLDKEADTLEDLTISLDNDLNQLYDDLDNADSDSEKDDINAEIDDLEPIIDANWDQLDIDRSTSSINWDTINENWENIDNLQDEADDIKDQIDNRKTNGFFKIKRS